MGRKGGNTIRRYAVRVAPVLARKRFDEPEVLQAVQGAVQRARAQPHTRKGHNVLDERVAVFWASARLVKISTDASPARRNASSPGLLAVWWPGVIDRSPSTVTNISVNEVVGETRSKSGRPGHSAPAYFKHMEFLVDPNDPTAAQRPSSGREPVAAPRLPVPHLDLVYRLDAALGEPLDVGQTEHGHRRIVPLTGGTFVGPELSGDLIPGASADWQVLLPDGTSLADLRYTLRTRDGAVLYVQAHGVRHGSPDVLARLGRGEDVDASEYTFRTSTHIETAAPELDWLNKGVFISVGGRQPGAVIYETYLVG